MKVIELTEVSVFYGKKAAAKNISFCANTGEITVLLGKNGSGKSTLVRACCGSLSYNGNIKLDGEEVSKMKPMHRSRVLSVMPQIQRSPGVSVKEMVSYGRQPYTGISGILSKKDKEIVQSTIEKTGLTQFSQSSVSTLSGGERQRAYFAMLLAQDTPNVILDEPGTFLDAEYMNFLCSFLLRQKNEGKTVLAVLHDINRAVEIADRLVVLDRGICFNGNSQEFIESDCAQSLFGLEKYECTDKDGNRRVFYR